MKALLQPHRIVMLAIAAAIVLWCVFTLRWDWLPKYLPLAVEGIGAFPSLRNPRVAYAPFVSRQNTVEGVGYAKCIGIF